MNSYTNFNSYFNVLNNGENFYQLSPNSILPLMRGYKTSSRTILMPIESSGVSGFIQVYFIYLFIFGAILFFYNLTCLV